MACNFNCTSCPCPIKTIRIETNTTNLILVLPITQDDYDNGEILKIAICQTIPILEIPLPVLVRIGEVEIPLQNLCGNYLMSDQLKPRNVYCCKVGTNPNHLTLIGNSPICPTSFDYPELIIEEDSPEFRGIQMQLVQSGNTTLNNTENVIFDTLINSQSSNISYNFLTGEFTFSRLGTYFITWTIATDGTEESTIINFSVYVNGILVSSSSTPIVTGQLSGSTLVTITSIPSLVTLVNTSGDTINFAKVPIQANIVVLEELD